MKRWMWVVLAAVALLLSGCVDYQETLVLERDGSGEFSMLVGMDMSMFAMFDDMVEEAEDVEEDPAFIVDEEMEGIRLIREETWTDEDGWEWSDVALAFDTLEALQEAFADSDDDPIGQIHWYQDGDHWVFERNMAPVGGMDEEPMDAATLQMMSGFFGNSEFRYTVRFPGQIIKTNAEVENVDHQNNTVTWVFSMQTMTAEPQTMHATIRP